MWTAQTIASQEETVQEIARRLVAFYHPVRIYLLGSVVRRALSGIKAASDIVPWRRTDFGQRAAWVRRLSRPQWSGKAASCMSPRELPANEAQGWLAKAVDDLECATLLATSGHEATRCIIADRLSKRP